MLEASMVVIGDEILGGYVRDANSPWFADRARDHGVPLTRVHVVPDEMAAIDEALSAELARSRPRLVLTSGGIGSTPDDITYEAVAATLGRDVAEDPVLRTRIERAVTWTEEQGVEVDDRFRWHFLRMARIPEGGRLLTRAAGWAPGVAVDLDGGCADGEGGATVVILPGVPALFRAIVTEVVEPDLMAGRNELPTVIEIEHRFPESALNLTFAQVLERFPDVRLGSYPGLPMVVRLTGHGAAVEGAAALVREAVEGLESTPGGSRLATAWAQRLGDSQEGA